MKPRRRNWPTVSYPIVNGPTLSTRQRRFFLQRSTPYLLRAQNAVANESGRMVSAELVMATCNDGCAETATVASVCEKGPKTLLNHYRNVHEGQ